MTTLRRLSNDNVKTVFDCIYNNRKPDSDQLTFKIIVVGSSGMKLSPPSYEFEDGLYILLKPLKKTKNGKNHNTGPPEDDPRIPSNLKSMIFKEKPKLTCPWSLSGPQFPVPTSIQQRYCYPKGDPEYSSMKGGALWTVYDENGKEDLEYRLLHVYYSAKRAGNKGRPSSSTNMSPRKKVKQTNTTQELPISPLDHRSFASASFDSHLSFDLSNSPVDPSIFNNLLVNPTSENDSNENESIITPDRSIFDARPTQDQSFDPRYPPAPHAKHPNQSYPTQQATHRRHGSSSTNNPSYPVAQYPHYYHSYPYWAPPPVSSNPPSQSYSMDSYDSRFMSWGSPNVPINKKHSSNQHHSHSYPVQEERKSSSKTIREKVKNSDEKHREHYKKTALDWSRRISRDPLLIPAAGNNNNNNNYNRCPSIKEEDLSKSSRRAEYNEDDVKSTAV